MSSLQLIKFHYVKDSIPKSYKAGIFPYYSLVALRITILGGYFFVMLGIKPRTLHNNEAVVTTEVRLRPRTFISTKC